MCLVSTRHSARRTLMRAIKYTYVIVLSFLLVPVAFFANNLGLVRISLLGEGPRCIGVHSPAYHVSSRSSVNANKHIRRSL